MNELVSVIIPTYGRPQFLKRAIDSVLTQSYENIEIIVVDDNGDNGDGRKNTMQLMRAYECIENIIYITYSKNMNGSYARNRGIERANGTYIAFLDDDDEMLPDKIRLQVEQLSRLGEEWGANYTTYCEKKNLGITEISKENRQGSLHFEALSRSLYICGGSNLMIRKTVINKIGLFDESFKKNQDIEFLARVLKYYKIAHVDSLQLIIHLENRIKLKGNYEYRQSIEIDEFYLDKFRADINALEKKNKQRLYQYFALERFKRSLGTNNEMDGLKNILKNRVSFILFVKYLWYLYQRKTKKVIYGFIF